MTRRERGGHALDPRLPAVEDVLQALEVLVRGARPDADPSRLRTRALGVAYRFLFAELAGAAGVEVTTRDALAGLEGTLDPDEALCAEARSCLRADPAWVAVDVVRLGRLHEELLAWQPVHQGGRWTWHRGGRLRKAGGSYFTPGPLVEHLLDQTLDVVVERTDPSLLTGTRVLDPACGAGAFLVPASRRLARLHEAAGKDADVAWRLAVSCVRGIDVDPAVLELARVCLWLDPLTRASGVPGERPPSLQQLRVEVPLVAADAVTGPGPGTHVDVVVGNPPFANQLERLTARDAAATRLLRSAAEGVAAYTDLSAVFLLRALSWVAPGGRVGLVQPTSVLSARDAAPVRRAVVDAGALRSVWSAGSGVFDASVPTCALVVEVGAEQGAVRRWQGADPVPGADADVGPDGLGEEWGHLLAAGLGIPEVRLHTDGSVGDLADCTADFRDQYYGLEPFVREASLAGEDGGTQTPLVTSGLIDPAVCHWGRRRTRFLKRAWRAPVVDVAALSRHASLGPWASRRLVAKVLVATQGRVLEAVADPDGRLLPSVPVLTVQPRGADDLWRLLAVLLAPPVSAYAAARYAGSALNPAAVKLSAKQVAALPLPAGQQAWDDGAAAVRDAQEAAEDDVRRGHLLRAGGHLCAAYGVTGADAEQVMDWWSSRLP